ncbi:MAG TPA: hypothetical protein VM802_18165 [Chitinophaga sp.]|uniref:hypothetical protein n=1 Tax=Chitinophaga sp. TaxID=1869181 RepID=UPI002C353EC8|nr:hypothetical protein [Chitinophaga sp.]HVI46810.1 hypothetical protein [Chitinophaga sp.]
MKRSYNPFQEFVPQMLSYFISAGKKWFLVQHFPWPGIEPGKGFMISPYESEVAGKEHAVAIDATEGKLLDLSNADALRKLTELLSNKEIRCFLNTIDAESDENMRKAYLKKIQANIRGKGLIQVNREEGLQVTFRLYPQGFFAILQSGQNQAIIPAINLIQ